MDTLLITVTVLSLVMAMAMGVMLARLLREERRRSDARVAALTEMASEPAPAVIASHSPRPVAVARRVEVQRPVDQPGEDADLPLRPPFSPRSVAAPLPEAAVAGVADLFAEPERTSPWGRRLVIIACLVTAMGLGGALVFRGVTASQPQAAKAAAAEAVSPGAPLELLSLRYAQDDQGLTVSGIVRNPRSGATIRNAAASAFVFAPDGAFLASGRAPLDYTTLEPGGESPFVVAVPVKGTVARYRVGFRSEAGGVLAHVDKRGPESLTQRF
jgi:hypothetical protein